MATALEQSQQKIVQGIYILAGTLLALLVGTNVSLFLSFIIGMIGWGGATSTNLWMAGIFVSLLLYTFLVSGLQALSNQFDTEGPPPTLSEDMLIGYWIFVLLNLAFLVLLASFYIFLGWDFLWEFFTAVFPILEAPIS